MFGRKKIKELKVMHYEGIQGLPMNCPCSFMIANGIITIKTRQLPTITITLPLNRVKSISAIGEYEYMQRYHSAGMLPNNNQIARNFLVIIYDKGIIALWGVGLSVFKNFMKIQNLYGYNTSYIEL